MLKPRVCTCVIWLIIIRDDMILGIFSSSSPWTLVQLITSQHFNYFYHTTM
uniref:Uncharacterized protein n=1 Tax=Lepeophtheirus salmonis TaxID=72036 RepID=A0A0K2SVX6_LEPSM